MLSVWCLVPGNYPTARRLRPLRSLLEDRTIAEKSIDLILSRYLDLNQQIADAMSPSDAQVLTQVRNGKQERLTSLTESIMDRSRANRNYYSNSIVPLDEDIEDLRKEISEVVREQTATEGKLDSKKEEHALKTKERTQLEDDLAAKERELKEAREAYRAAEQEQQGGDDDD